MFNKAVKWDHRFLALAHQIASWSKDESTKVGALIVDSNNRIVATGYNGVPCRVEDKPERYQRPDKLHYVGHAEVNAIYDAASRGVSTRDCTLYSTLYPCSSCAIGIIQAGITTVVTRPIPKSMIRWGESFDASGLMFGDAGVAVFIVNSV